MNFQYPKFGSGAVQRPVAPLGVHKDTVHRIGRPGVMEELREIAKSGGSRRSGRWQAEAAPAGGLAT
jgi:hypothetical protein